MTKRKRLTMRKIKRQSFRTYAETFLPPIINLLVNCMVYWGAPLISAGFPVHNLSGHLENLIPIMPAFIVVYYGCFIFWAVNYIIIAVQDREHKYRFFTADLYARLICFVCFVFSFFFLFLVPVICICYFFCFFFSFFLFFFVFFFFFFLLGGVWVWRSG